jgi:hypothetical protein
MTIRSLVQGSKSLTSHLVKASLLPCPFHLEFPFARSIVIFLCLVGMISSSLVMSRKRPTRYLSAKSMISRKRSI